MKMVDLMGFISLILFCFFFFCQLLDRVWRNIIRKGDTVVDATCGNGHDTLAMLKLVANDSGKGCVYGMDIQDSALESTSSLLDRSVSPNEVMVLQFLL